MRNPLASIIYSRKVSAVITIAVLCWFAGFPFYSPRLEAERLSFVSDTLSTSVPSFPSNHFVSFKTSTGVGAGQSIKISLPSFDLGAIDYTDVDLSDDGVDLDLSDSASGSTWGVSVNGTDITITSDLGTIGANSTTTIKLGKNAVYGTTGTHQITNPVLVGSYIVSIGGTQVDSAETRVTILSPVLVTAGVNTLFNFTVSGVSEGLSVNGDAVLTGSTTSSELLPFGLLTPGNPVVLAQDLTVTTNAKHGFAVTVTAAAPITASNGSQIRTFVDGADTSTPVVWSPPSADSNNSLTFGHQGITSDDADEGGAEFSGTKYAGNFVGTPRAVFSHTGSANGTTQNKGKARVGFKVEISPLQPSGSDYEQDLWYTATPTF